MKLKHRMISLLLRFTLLGGASLVDKNVDFPPERLVDYSLLREVQEELAIQ